MTLLGIGYDVHRLVRGRKLILGGVDIPHDTGLDGHSDADALCHAIADAALGAIGERDIGFHFPNSDESIRGISSIEILRRVALILAAQHARVLNVDSTIIAEAPKMAPHIAAMRENIAAALGLPARRVGVKATTNEMLGFAGRGEGIAALAITNVEQTDEPAALEQVIA
ncbi:MAG TPA: 2-C-methyl-D-erythritol 2,4-cyclodiphosphate synthase [Steroidobacteraceae bacterium]|jgi:2-C-methyl-D-erythritol 2,4-cyclodiphosphate synthase|nr:2-C-methyl-D-erythritol 2,4-cyclodiphosphate synthase [Steroidobacteraceae bacterium]